MSLIRLTIDRISYSQNTNGAYALLLQLIVLMLAKSQITELIKF